MHMLFALREKVVSIPGYDTNLDCELRQVTFSFRLQFSIKWKNWIQWHSMILKNYHEEWEIALITLPFLLTDLPFGGSSSFWLLKKTEQYAEDMSVRRRVKHHSVGVTFLPSAWRKATTKEKNKAVACWAPTPFPFGFLIAEERQFTSWAWAGPGSTLRWSWDPVQKLTDRSTKQFGPAFLLTWHLMQTADIQRTRVFLFSNAIKS